MAMTVREIGGVRIAAICACIPGKSVPNDEKVAKATGIAFRRIAETGVHAVDLCVKAAERVMADTNTRPSEIGAVISVSFTQRDRMPCSAAQAQKLLGLPNDIMAFDVMLACSGWGYGLFIAGMLARQFGKKVLLLDGDVQSEFVDRGDPSVVPVLADGGSATLVVPDSDADSSWCFAFAAHGEKGDALRLEHGGSIRMNGFEVFRFVATDVAKFIREFIAATCVDVNKVDFFVPHQANVFMVGQLAKAVGFKDGRTLVSCDRIGNLSSASIPVTIAWHKAAGKVLFSGFGGGLSISAGVIGIARDCCCSVVEV